MEIFDSQNYFQSSKRIREIGHERIIGGYRRIVFLNGCFDIIHKGHLQTISHAVSIAGTYGAVVVGINSDESIRRIKGEDHPIFDVEHRALILVNLKFVDHVVVFSEDTPLKLISALKPDVIVKGSDYKIEDVVGKNLAHVSLAPYVDDISTTKILDRIRNYGK
jgi:D-beta-D-heptose 7-phosphate kinase/D-beta-D-heptose 1-phosphate adenosyltransferase